MSNKSMPKISILSPLYNSTSFIGWAIQNIQSQTIQDFEMLTVDDGSTDDTKEVVRKFIEKDPRIKYFYKENGGAGSAVAEGLLHAHGEYIAFCDQDDWWLPEKLEKQIHFLEEHQDIDLVYSDAYIGDAHGALMRHTWMQTRKVVPCEGGYTECAKELFKRNFICAPLVVLVRKSALDKIGGIHTAYLGAYDYDVWFRLLECGSRFGYIAEPLAVWRSHTQNESRHIRKAKKMQLKILCAFLKRNPLFVLQHPLLVSVKMMRIFGAFLLNFNPYKR